MEKKQEARSLAYSNRSLRDTDSLSVKLINGYKEKTVKQSRGAFMVDYERRKASVLIIPRFLFIVILASAALVTAIMMLHFTRQAEKDAFETHFDGIATRIVEGMKSDTALRFWMARSLANSVTMAMEASATTSLSLRLPTSRWEKITEEARFNGKAAMVTWSPILESDDERTTFEAFARTQQATIGANPECFLCGTPDRGYSNPTHMVELFGFGTIPCGGLEKTGRQGVIPAENCEAIAAALEGTCRCTDLPPEADVATKSVDKSDAIFRLLKTGPKAESQESGPYSPVWQASALDVIKMPIMYNQMSEPVRAAAIQNMKEAAMPTMSEIFVREGPYYQQHAGQVGSTSSVVYYPVFDPSDQHVVGTVGIDIVWEQFSTTGFPPNSQLVDVVVQNSCGQSYTFKVDSENNALELVGEGDIHEMAFGDDVLRMTTFEEYEELVEFAAPRSKDQSTLDYCRYRFIVYPTRALAEEHFSSNPYTHATVTGAIVMSTALLFIIYDWATRRR